MSDLDDILRRLSPANCKRVASSEIVALAEREIGMRLPVDYLELMQHSNGVEAFLGGTGYLVLWPMEQLTALIGMWVLYVYSSTYVYSCLLISASKSCLARSAIPSSATPSIRALPSPLRIQSPPGGIPQSLRPWRTLDDALVCPLG